MEIKDNAYEENQTGEVAEATAGNGDMPALASTDLGKFKDVSALLKAYDSLQSEFTRRSQRLKELERQTQQIGDLGVREQGSDGAEKLKTRAKERKAEEARFDAFVQDIERKETQPNSLPIREGERSGEEESAELRETDKEAFVGSERADALSSEELFTLASRDENVRLKIVGEYLASLGKSDAPLMRGGAGLCVSPTLRAKSIDEAGTMALRMFKQERQTQTY